MDGHITIVTDDKGKFIDWENYWCRTTSIEEGITDCANCYLQDYTFTPNSLTLITFNLVTDRSYDYWSGCYYYYTNLIIKDEIILLKNYNKQIAEIKWTEDEFLNMDESTLDSLSEVTNDWGKE